MAIELEDEALAVTVTPLLSDHSRLKLELI